MKKIMVFLLCSLSWQTQTMLRDLAVWALGVNVTSEKVESKQQQTVQKEQQTKAVSTEQTAQQSGMQMKQESIPLVHTTGPTTFILNNNTYNHNNNNMAQNNPVTNSVETNTNTNVQTEAHAHATSTATSEATAQAYQTMWNEYKDQMSTFWQDNKWYAGASALAAFYGYHCYQVVCGNFYLRRTDLWSSWKRELSFDQLCQIPQQQLARELMMSVQQQGLDAKNPMNFTTPFVLFLQTIEQERNTLLYYQTLHKRITMLRCRLLFPFNTKRYKQIDARLQRLSLVKNIFISWMADVNLKHAQSAPGPAPAA